MFSEYRKFVDGHNYMEKMEKAIDIKVSFNAIVRTTEHSALKKRMEDRY